MSTLFGDEIFLRILGIVLLIGIIIGIAVLLKVFWDIILVFMISGLSLYIGGFLGYFLGNLFFGSISGVVLAIILSINSIVLIWKFLFYLLSSHYITNIIDIASGEYSFRADNGTLKIHLVLISLIIIATIITFL